MAILGKLVPQAELFLKPSGASINVKGGGEDARKKQLQIKRFDPSDPVSYALVVRLYLLFQYAFIDIEVKR
jgi:hypothetical protein